MPTTNKGAKAVFDSGKTSSYHIDSVHSCQSGKSSSAFRMVVLRDGGNKRYEFEAESAKIASAFHHYSIAYTHHHHIALRLTALHDIEQTRLYRLLKVSSLRWNAQAVSLANHGGANKSVDLLSPSPACFTFTPLV
jgi:hypothetical protein